MPVETRTTTENLDGALEQHRRELTGYCYRLLGSGFEAEDAVQETFLRAWKAEDRLEARAALRSWLYRIATNVCIDMQRGPQRRARPMDLRPASTVATAVLAVKPDDTWVQPAPDARIIDFGGDPAEVAAARDTVRLAFVAALQHLPPKQRVALVLCDVLRWSGAETAQLMATSTASVNSALQRARATLARIQPDGLATEADAEHQDLLDRYVDAFERYDMSALVALLHEDAIMSMPPYDLWLQGRDTIVSWNLGPGSGCRGSKLIRTAANGTAAFASYKPTSDGRLEPWALQIVEVRAGRISALHNFIDPALFEYFALPAFLPA